MSPMSHMRATKNSAKIWIVEDDPNCNFVYDRLLSEVHQLKTFLSIQAFESEFLKLKSSLTPDSNPDLLIIDLHLPDGEFTDWLRSSSMLTEVQKIPFIVISCIDDLDVLKESFQLGAQDYLTKPFGHAELDFKVNRLLSQRKNSTIQDLRLDPFRRRVVFRDQVSTELTPREFQVLFTLYESPQYTCTRAKICSNVWSDVVVQTKTFDVHLVHLRQKIKPLGLAIEFSEPCSYQLVFKDILMESDVEEGNQSSSWDVSPLTDSHALPHSRTSQTPEVELQQS